MTCPNPGTCPCDCHNGHQRPCDQPGGCGLTDPNAAHLERITIRRTRITQQLTDFATDIDSLLTTYLTRVARLIPEHGTPTSDSDTRTKTKVIGSPAPWNDIAAGWYYDVHAGARRHETHLRTELAFTTLNRSTTDASTALALRALPALAEAVLDLAGRRDMNLNVVSRAVTDISTWCREARRILDDDPLASERTTTKAPGGLTCPHCERRLVLKHGWQHDTNPAVWCQRCPSTIDDDHPRARDLSWPADAWIAVLQQDA